MSGIESILVVEDDAGVRGLVERRLTSAGYSVAAVGGGLEALSSIDETRPDLVLMDISMPGMDGVETCRHIAARWPGLAVVFLTALGEVDERVRALDAGGRDVVLKPFSAPDLLARVRATLREKALRDAAVRRAEVFERLALTDALSGVWSRLYLETRLPEELARAARYGRPLACLMVDVDDFKHVNDEHGHAVGDDVIRGVGSILHDGLRSVDFVARYGGEEFVVVLPETSPEGAVVAADRMREQVAAARIGERALRVTVSIGIAPGTSADVLLRADAALYAAKGAGKNRVVLHGSEA